MSGTFYNKKIKKNKKYSQIGTFNFFEMINKLVFDVLNIIIIVIL